MKPTLTMLSKSGCPHCDTSRAWLEAHGIAYTEIKHGDDTERAAMYDRLGLVGSARTVPQFVLEAGGDRYVISGARDLMHTGVESLFGWRVVTSLKPAVSIAVRDDAAGVVAFEPTCEACE